MVRVQVINLAKPSLGRSLTERFFPGRMPELPLEYGLKVDFIDDYRRYNISIAVVRTIFSMDEDTWEVMVVGPQRIIFGRESKPLNVILDFAYRKASLTAFPLINLDVDVIHQDLLGYLRRSHLEPEVAGIKEVKAFVGVMKQTYQG